MQLYHNTDNEPIINVDTIYKRQQLINGIKKRFSTYGYNEIYTSTFESYDLYATMNGTVNHHEMIKTIDNTGEVLVLRPDITIPLTQKIAETNKTLQDDLRYFYILDVFRQTTETSELRESTQAGVEYFGNDSPNADAEIIALSIQMLKDLTIENFKIELGHSGFFKQVTKELNLATNELNELKRFIEAKNVTGLEPFLTQLGINEDLQSIIKAIPFLYGKPNDVIKRAKQLPLTEEMNETLNNLSDIYSILTNYNVEDFVVIDLGLINHMDYYSDMIFQGFIERVAKPVLMGGRYNKLADQFNANIPAIGFACDIDLLLDATPEDQLPQLNLNDITLLYENDDQANCLQLANELRQQNIRVLTYPLNDKEKVKQKSYFIAYKQNENWILEKDEKLTTLQTSEQLINLIKERE